MNDKQYVHRVLRGDRDAFRHLVDNHKDIAYSLAYRISGNPSDAEEIVQDAFVKAYTKLKSFREDAAFSTWLYRIVYNTAVSWLRDRTKRKPESGYPEKTEHSLSDTYEEKNDLENREHAVRWAITQLKPVDRTIVTLFYHEDQTLKEIAEVTGISENNVKIRLFRAREKMKTLLLKQYQEVFAE